MTKDNRAELREQFGSESRAEVFLAEFGYGVRIVSRSGNPVARILSGGFADLWQSRVEALRVAAGYNDGTNSGHGVFVLGAGTIIG